MRISEALGDVAPLDVKFASGAVLHIEFRPPSYTIEQIEAAQADRNNPDRLIKMIQQVVTKWDLDDAHGEPISLADADQIKREVPITVFNQIMKAIRDANDVGEA